MLFCKSFCDIPVFKNIFNQIFLNMIHLGKLLAHNCMIFQNSVPDDLDALFEDEDGDINGFLDDAAVDDDKFNVR